MGPATILTIAIIAGAFIFFASGYLFGQKNPALMATNGAYEDFHDTSLSLFSRDASLDEMLTSTLHHCGAKSVHIFDGDGLEVAGVGQRIESASLGAQVGLTLSLLRSENVLHKSVLLGDRTVRFGRLTLRCLGAQCKGPADPSALWLATVEGVQDLDPQHSEQIFQTFKQGLYRPQQAA